MGTDFQLLGPVQQIWEVKVHNVVTSDDIRINSLYKITPCLINMKMKGSEVKATPMFHTHL